MSNSSYWSNVVGTHLAAGKCALIVLWWCYFWTLEGKQRECELAASVIWHARETGSSISTLAFWWETWPACLCWCVKPRGLMSVTGEGRATGTAGVFVRMLMGYQGQKPRAVSAEGPYSGLQRRKKKIPIIANKYFWVRWLAPLLTVSWPLQLASAIRGGRMNKLDKPWAHPSTWKVAGVKGEGR